MQGFRRAEPFDSQTQDVTCSDGKAAPSPTERVAAGVFRARNARALVPCRRRRSDDGALVRLGFGPLLQHVAASNCGHPADTEYALNNSGRTPVVTSGFSWCPWPG